MTPERTLKLRVVREVLDGRRTRLDAARALGLSDRQVRRLCARVRGEGDRGILHRLLGRPSNHGLDPELLERALSALHDPSWEGLGPTAARERLARDYGLELSVTTVRWWMGRAGLWPAPGPADSMEGAAPPPEFEGMRPFPDFDRAEITA